MSKPDYQRLLRTFNFEEPDCVPMMELTVDHPIQEQFLGRKIKTLDDEIQFYYQAGYDYIYQKPTYEFPGIPPVLSFGTDIRRDAQEQHEDISFDSHTTQHLRTREDLKNYHWPDPERIDYSKLDYTAEHLPQGMAIIGGIGGIFARSWILMGFENFCMTFIENPSFVGEVFERIGTIQVEVARRLVRKKKVIALWYSDDFAYAEAPMISPDYIRQYLFPHMRKMAGIAHEAGLPYIYHGCGRLTEVIDDLIELGVDVLHPIEPKAMDIYEIKRKYYKRLAIIGNIDVGEVLTRGTPEMIEAEVKEHIKRLAPGGGYAIGSSNTICYYIPIENYRAFIESVKKYGNYPISIE